MRRWERWFDACCVFVLAAGLAQAQRTTATLYGVVHDPSAAAVPGATLRLVNDATGDLRESSSNAMGEFTFAFVPPGRYRLEASAQGFKTYSRTGLALSANEQIRLVAELELGTSAEQITVSAEAAQLQDAAPTLNDRISRLQLSELPQSRRDFTELLGLENGIQPRGSGLFSFNGLAAGGSNITVDGVDGAGDVETSSTSMFNAFNIINVISQEAIGEVNVSKGVYSAEVGRTFGGNINIVTRAGTNQYHGSLFENWQNDILNARYALLSPSSAKPPVRFHQFGGSIGGPIIKDRLFFFGVYEGYRQSSSAILTETVPTPEFKAQAIAAVPDYRQMLEFFPRPTESYPANAVTGIFRGAGSNTADDNHAVARVDYRISDRYQLNFRYKRSRPNQIVPRAVAVNERTFEGISESGNATLTRTSAAWSSETRFGINLNDAGRLDGLHSRYKIAMIEIPGVFGGSAESLINRGHAWSLEEVVVHPVGKHVLKFGGIYFDRNPRRYDEEIPVIRYSNAADLLANRPNVVQVTFGQPPYEGHCWELGFFFQDDIRLRPNLVLNAGLRYEYFSVYRDKSGHFFNPDGIAGAVSVPPRFRPADSAYDADRNNFSPRVGFAWTLDRDSRNVVRGGFGMAYAPLSLRTFATSHYLNPDLPWRFRFSRADAAALGLKYPVTNKGMESFLFGNPVPRAYTTTDAKLQNPYNMQWSLDLQRQITPSLTFQTGYVGNKALKVTMSHNGNKEDYITGLRPFPQALSFTYRDDSDFSYYHGWQTSLRKRFSSGLSWNAHYTWSRTMGLGDGDFWIGGELQVQDETNWRSDLGPTLVDIPHRFVSDVVYEIPADRWTGASGPWKHIAGGWQISGIFSAITGAPLNVTQNSSRTSGRPDYAGRDPYANSSDRLLWLNGSAFSKVPTSSASGATIRPGNLGKNALRAPGGWNLNLSAAKSFTIREGVRLRFAADAFNAFNNTRLGVALDSKSEQQTAIVTDVSNSAFGRILTVGSARQIQLSARLTF